MDPLFIKDPEVSLQGAALLEVGETLQRKLTKAH